MIQYYCIPSCDKCRKARKLLKSNEIEYQETDMRKTPLSQELLQNWIDRYGLEKILNTKSATWRGLDDQLKSEIETNPATVINTNAAMLHRPILDFGDQIYVGKDALNWLENA